MIATDETQPTTAANGEMCWKEFRQNLRNSKCAVNSNVLVRQQAQALLDEQRKAQGKSDLTMEALVQKSPDLHTKGNCTKRESLKCQGVLGSRSVSPPNQLTRNASADYYQNLRDTDSSSHAPPTQGLRRHQSMGNSKHRRVERDSISPLSRRVAPDISSTSVVPPPPKQGFRRHKSMDQPTRSLSPRPNIVQNLVQRVTGHVETNLHDPKTLDLMGRGSSDSANPGYIERSVEAQSRARCMWGSIGGSAVNDTSPPPPPIQALRRHKSMDQSCRSLSPNLKPNPVKPSGEQRRARPTRLWASIGGAAVNGMYPGSSEDVDEEPSYTLAPSYRRSLELPKIGNEKETELLTRTPPNMKDEQQPEKVNGRGRMARAWASIGGNAVNKMSSSPPRKTTSYEQSHDCDGFEFQSVPTRTADKDDEYIPTSDSDDESDAEPEELDTAC